MPPPLPLQFIANTCCIKFMIFSSINHYNIRLLNFSFCPLFFWTSLWSWCNQQSAEFYLPMEMDMDTQQRNWKADNGGRILAEHIDITNNHVLYIWLKKGWMKKYSIFWTTLSLLNISKIENIFLFKLKN